MLGKSQVGRLNPRKWYGATLSDFEVSARNFQPTSGASGHSAATKIAGTSSEYFHISSSFNNPRTGKMMMILLLWAGVENWLAAQQNRNIAELLAQQERHRSEIIALQRSNQEHIDRRVKAVDDAFEVAERRIGEISKEMEGLR